MAGVNPTDPAGTPGKVLLDLPGPTGNLPGGRCCPRGMDHDFEAYVRENYPALRRLALLLCGDWATADDLVQTALIRCERRWHLVVEPHPYVRRAVVNAAGTWRVRRRLEAPLSALTDLAAADRGSDDRLLVLSALRSLPLGQRQVLVLRYFEGLCETEIAELLGISVGTVKSRAARALTALRSSSLLVSDLAGER